MVHLRAREDGLYGMPIYSPFGAQTLMPIGALDGERCFVLYPPRIFKVAIKDRCRFIARRRLEAGETGFRPAGIPGTQG